MLLYRFITHFHPQAAKAATNPTTAAPASPAESLPASEVWVELVLADEAADGEDEDEDAREMTGRDALEGVAAASAAAELNVEARSQLSFWSPPDYQSSRELTS